MSGATARHTMAPYTKAAKAVTILVAVLAAGHLRAQSARPPAPVPTPQSLLSIVHAQIAVLDPAEQADVLYDLAIAATGVDSRTSAQWAIEMYDVATNRMTGTQKWQQMNRAASSQACSRGAPEPAPLRGTYLMPHSHFHAAHITRLPRTNCS